MKILSTLLLFLLYANVQASVVIGASKNIEDKHSFVFSDTTFFQHSPYYRYGYGHIRGIAGPQSGFAGRSTGGFPVLWTGDFLYEKAGFFLSFDMGNTAFNWTHNNQGRNYYLLMPGVGAGFFSRMGTLSLDLVIKRGLSLNNLYSHRLLHPDIDAWTGWQAILMMSKDIGFSYDIAYVREDRLDSYGIFYNLAKNKKIIYRQDREFYDKISKTNMVLFNIEF